MGDVRTVAMTESTVEKTDTIPSLIYAYHGEDEVSCICDDPIFVAEKKMMSRRTQRHRMDDDSPSRIRQYFDSVHLQRQQPQQQREQPSAYTAATTRSTIDDDEKYARSLQRHFESLLLQEEEQQQRQQQPTTAAAARSGMMNEMELQRHFESL